jgi:hypothetical protein
MQKKAIFGLKKRVINKKQAKNGLQNRKNETKTDLKNHFFAATPRFLPPFLLPPLATVLFFLAALPPAP